MRVLGRHDEERLGQGARLALDRHLPLGHRLQQRALRPRGGAVDLVGQEDRRKHGAGDPVEARLPRVVDARTGDVRRQQVRGELHAREVRRDRGGDGPGERRLADPRHVRQEDVAADQERGQAQFHNPVLADDHPAHGVPQAPVDLPDIYRAFDPTDVYGPLPPRIAVAPRAYVPRRSTTLIMHHSFLVRGEEHARTSGWPRGQGAPRVRLLVHWSLVVAPDARNDRGDSFRAAAPRGH